jgi:hypothetical protein
MSAELSATTTAEAPRFPLPGYNGRRLIWQEREVEAYMRALVNAPPLPPAPPEEPVRVCYFRDVARRMGWSGRQLHRHIASARERTAATKTPSPGREANSQRAGDFEHEHDDARPLARSP